MINAIAEKYGNPGLTLAIQIRLSSKPEALISLDRKMHIQKEQTRRENSSIEIPPIWSIPLFEDIDSVKNIRAYLDRVWDYATQSRQTSQAPQSRFAEIIPEVFIAGSDLSQQVSQATAAFLYVKAKYEIKSWLAEHHVAEVIRIKLGSGEPMQRQGGYYSRVAGQTAFSNSDDSQRRFSSRLPEAARKSTAYAVTPLQGVFLGGDFKNLPEQPGEQLRSLPLREFVSLHYHVRESQQQHRKDSIQPPSPLPKPFEHAAMEMQELERLTVGSNDELMRRS